jgi:hypothetical protein
MGPFPGERAEEQPSSDRRSLVEPLEISEHDAFHHPVLDCSKKNKSNRSILTQRKCILLGILIVLLVRGQTSDKLELSCGISPCSRPFLASIEHSMYINFFQIRLRRFMLSCRRTCSQCTSGHGNLELTRMASRGMTL